MCEMSHVPGRVVKMPRPFQASALRTIDMEGFLGVVCFHVVGLVAIEVIV